MRSKRRKKARRRFEMVIRIRTSQDYQKQPKGLRGFLLALIILAARMLVGALGAAVPQ